MQVSVHVAGQQGVFLHLAQQRRAADRRVVQIRICDNNRPRHAGRPNVEVTHRGREARIRDRVSESPGGFVVAGAHIAGGASRDGGRL